MKEEIYNTLAILIIENSVSTKLEYYTFIQWYLSAINILAA